MQCALILCITTGMRRGGVMGIRWEDVNFADGTIHARHSLDNQLRYNEPKTKAGNRFLPLSETTRKALETRYAAQLEEFKDTAPDMLMRNKKGEITGIAGKAPLVSDETGKPMIPNSFGRWWNRNRASYGCPDTTLHGLRHTFLSLAAQNNVHPSIMQSLAGHSTSRITMEIYTHV